MMIDKKSILYKKLFGANILIIIFIIFALDMYMIKRHIDTEKSNVIYINKKLVEEVSKEINNLMVKSKTFTENIYNDGRIINDVLDFVKMERVSYLENKLNKFSNSVVNTYTGIESFTKTCFFSEDYLKEIAFISYTRNEIDTFNRRNEIAVDTIDENSFYNDSNFSNVICRDGMINFTVRLNNPVTYKPEGTVIFTYSLGFIDNILSRYSKNQDLIIWDNNVQIVYDSKDINRVEEEKLRGTSVTLNLAKALEKDYYLNRKDNQASLIIIGKVLKSSISTLSPSFMGSLILIDLLVFAIAEMYLYLKLKRLNYRIGNIILAMDKVKEGDFNISIPISTTDNDELNYIAKNFNHMCIELTEHIEKSYLAEIEQHKAEMVALQNQINPHFLYNTLESIRMKAICNNDREVGKMLYSLAFLFRSQLKEKNRIPIKNEIDYCNKYIEIFKFRYEDIFKYSINCDEDIKNKEIIKFSLQPLIENYFVHGIRLDQTDNIFVININRSENKKDIIIEIIDNGVGIDDQKLTELNNMLLSRVQLGSSIGVFNANERLVIAYGQEYGIRIEKTRECGTKVIVRIPCIDIEGGNNNA